MNHREVNDLYNNIRLEAILEHLWLVAKYTETAVLPSLKPKIDDEIFNEVLQGTSHFRTAYGFAAAKRESAKGDTNVSTG